MHLTSRAASRLPRPRIGQGFTATPLTAVRHSSNISPDDFVKQSVGTPQEPHIRDDGTNKTPVKTRKVVQTFRKVQQKKLFSKVDASDFPSIKIRRVQIGEHDQPPSMGKRARANTVLPAEIPPAEVGNGEAASHFTMTRHDNRHRENTKPWSGPTWKWDHKPPSVFSRKRSVNLRRLPLATTTQDIIFSIDNAVRENNEDRRSTRIEDIVIRTTSDSSEEVDVVVDFRHPEGAKMLYRLAARGKFRVKGVVPEAFLNDPKDSSEIPQPSEDTIIAQLSKQDRAELFEAPELRKVVRRTRLVYN